jgi:hypothetical protein
MPRPVLIEVLGGRDRADQRLRLGVDWALNVRQLPLRTVVAQRGGAGDPTPGSLPAHAVGGQGGARWPAAVSPAFEFSAGEFLALLNTLAAESPREHRVEPPRYDLREQEGVINVSQSVPG